MLASRQEEAVDDLAEPEVGQTGDGVRPVASPVDAIPRSSRDHRLCGVVRGPAQKLCIRQSTQST